MVKKSLIPLFDSSFLGGLKAAYAVKMIKGKHFWLLNSGDQAKVIYLFILNAENQSGKPERKIDNQVDYLKWDEGHLGRHFFVVCFQTDYNI